MSNCGIAHPRSLSSLQEAVRLLSRRARFNVWASPYYKRKRHNRQIFELMRRMREQSVPGSPSPSYREPGYEATGKHYCISLTKAPLNVEIGVMVKINTPMINVVIKSL